MVALPYIAEMFVSVPAIILNAVAAPDKLVNLGLMMKWPPGKGSTSVQTGNEPSRIELDGQIGPILVEVSTPALHDHIMGQAAAAKSRNTAETRKLPFRG